MESEVLPEYCAATLPRWKCHKEVSAFKIRQIRSLDIGAGDSARVLIESTEGGTVTVGPEFMKKHRPQIGGYYVRYDDGYESFSPAKAFEDGYSKLKPGEAGAGSDSCRKTLM